MAIDRRAELQRIRTFPALIAYLRNELGWPIESDDFEELTFDYTPEELGIDSASAAKIQEIKRLRPLTPSQPWGIFFVKFEPKQLPVVALRRILSRVVLKKRASSNSDDRAAWAADDLLFVSNFGRSDARQISFAHFSQDESRLALPVLKVLGWDNQDTQLHLNHIVDTLHDHLSWPDDEADTNAWRANWRGAFTLRHREVITTSKALAERLAELARVIRDRIATGVAIETDDGPLTRLMSTFREALVHDLDADGFADTYAQTIAYGLLSARIADPKASTVDDFAGHMRTNPFLRELMESFLKAGGGGTGGGAEIDFDELGVNDVVELLDQANMEAVLRDFGDRNPQEDPVIHFYELFLKEYDAQKRMQRGVFYTPRAVVSYIVRSVDDLVRSDFGLADGLADTTSWREMARRNAELALPDGIDPDEPFVQILDPATGTGTFLVEIIEVIFQRMRQKWQDEGHNDAGSRTLWNEYVPKHLLPRLHGFELLMAPYAIAHLKVGLKLLETGYDFASEERARIYLTNSLEAPRDFSGQFAFAIPALAHEAQAVRAVKLSQRFTVIVGNPPYANYSANLTPDARALVDNYRTFAGQPIRERNQLQFERNLQDDFVKFIAIGEAALRQTGAGILGYITNATMLGSGSLRGMREHLMREFATLRELHLHGGVNEISESARDDENVFDISQAVAIHIYVRRPHSDSELCFAEVWGARTEKYSYLTTESTTSTEWEVVLPDAEYCAFLPQEDANGLATVRVDDVFVKFGAGIKTNRDAVAIAFSKAALKEAVEGFAPGLVSSPTAAESIRPLLYRPFDERFIFYHQDIVASRSLPTMQHMLAGENLGLVASSTWTSPERFSVNVSRTMVEMKTGTHDRGTTEFPLYRYESILGARPERVLNLQPDFVKRWTDLTGTEIDAGATGGADAISPEALFQWIYTLCYSTGYRRRYRAMLAQGFPIVVFPRTSALLSDIVRLGGELVDVHLMTAPVLDNGTTQYVGPQGPEVDRVGWSDETIWLDARATRRGAPAKAGTIGFRGVSEAVWTFHMGGYPVCYKWLKDRRGLKLSRDEIVRYQRVLVALGETVRLMNEVDNVVERHGGWPDAFVPS